MGLDPVCVDSLAGLVYDTLMDYAVVVVAAFGASCLTFFSGFGLGTLLMPVFALFFPLEQAVAATAFVHFLNNIFKFFLTVRHADWPAAWKFGFPALLSSVLGASLLLWLASFPPLTTYTIGAMTARVDVLKIVIAAIMILFAVVEISPRYQSLSFDRKFLPIGGALSGFFGGLSGHQGALRSAFLIRLGLSKESFIATGVVIACVVDLARLTIYLGHFSTSHISESAPLLGAATLAAFFGSFLGKRLLNKVTIQAVQISVSVMLFIIAVLLGLGLA